MSIAAAIETSINQGTSLLGKKWPVRPTKAELSDYITDLYEGEEAAVTRLLATRILPYERELFTQPKLESLLQQRDPRRMHGLQGAVEAIEAALEQGQRIFIHGDFDVDGITATAILLRTLQGLGAELGSDLEYYNPARKQGHAPQNEVIEASGAELVIIVDSGATAHEVIAKATARGQQVVVLDHHDMEKNPDGSWKLPSADAVVNAEMEPVGSPYAKLSGAGLSWLTSRLLAERAGLPGLADEMEAYAGLGQRADVMPMDDVLNRYLVRRSVEAVNGMLMDIFEGFELQTVFDHLSTAVWYAQKRGDHDRLNRWYAKIDENRDKITHPGLFALAEELAMDGRFKRTLTGMDLAFYFSPVLNSANRMHPNGPEEIQKMVRLLTTDDLEEARTIAREVVAQNAVRKEEQSELLAEVMQEAHDQVSQWANAIVLYRPDWGLDMAGYLGLIAGKLKETFHLPTAVGTEIEGEARFSARAPKGINLGDAIRKGKDAALFLGGGGHDGAGGWQMDPARVPALTAFLGQSLHEQMQDLRAQPDYGQSYVDAYLCAQADWLKHLDDVAPMRPYGPGNEDPTYVAEGLKVVKCREIQGGLSLNFTFDNGAQTLLWGVGRPDANANEKRMADALKHAMEEGLPVHVKGTLARNTWQKKESPKLRIEDIGFGDLQALFQPESALSAALLQEMDAACGEELRQKA